MIDIFLEKRIHKACEKLAALIYTDEIKIDSLSFAEDIIWANDFPEADAVNTSNIRLQGVDRNVGFSFHFEIPQHFAGQCVALRVFTGREGQWDATNPQFLAYVNGNISQGLDTNHTELTLTEKAVAGDCYDIRLMAWTGMVPCDWTIDVRCCCVDKAVRALYFDIKVPLEAANLMPKGARDWNIIIESLNTAVSLLDFRYTSDDAWALSVETASRYMAERFYGELCGKHTAAVVHAVGHTHIDVAWLWRLCQTEAKTVRSFATALKLMEEYPEYRFMSSQPQLYEYFKKHAPELYETIKQRVREGRWEAEGAMWIEPDCNLSSGESLIRQIIYGKRFFREEFGVDSKLLWLPDVFGYSAALPQILNKCGIEAFMTTKISWNETNKMPCDTFLWEGIDGSRILTYFVTTCEAHDSEKTFTTYVGTMTPSQIKGTWERFQQKGLIDEAMTLYGYGDGGGGTTPAMIEYAQRMAYGIPGLPKVQFSTAAGFFSGLKERVGNHKRLPLWVGELYLEFHRGTYTAMSRNKKYNRKCELAYIDAEWLSVLSGSAYPREALNEGWKTILLNQFHDILPGSSIKEVYEDSREQYEAALASVKRIQNDAISAICARLTLKHESAVVFNSLSFERNDVAELATGDCMSAFDGKDPLPSQNTYDGKLIFLARGVPSKGYKSFRLVPSQMREPLPAFDGTLDNARLRICFDGNGDIISLYDKDNGRQILTGKCGLQAFYDMPAFSDNWQLADYYEEQMWPVDNLVDIRFVEHGPVRTVLRIEKAFMSSSIVQHIILYAHSARVDFKTWIDWREKNILLKAIFHTDIRSSHATYEIQYGSVERPTHRNTSWDAAKFEVCAQRWADLSEGGYGVSLLNDCKYGHDIKDGVMRLTLLKSTCYPNPDMDKEIHAFTYALYPHAGDWRVAETPGYAAMLNCPLYSKRELAHEGAAPASMGLICLNRRNVAVEVVKKAEDSDDVILRLYEFEGTKTQVEASVNLCYSRMYVCDMLENSLHELSSLHFKLKPYEIITIKLVASQPEAR